MKKLLDKYWIAFLLVGSLAACTVDEDPGNAAPRADAGPAETAGVTLSADVQAVRSAKDALPNVFIPPFEDCREPLAGEQGQGPGGKVCTNVAISGCTEEGKYFPDYAECDVVRSQRPFWTAPPTAEPRADDPRLDDTVFMGELAWVTEQIGASGCACCHDSKAVGGQAAQWDISYGKVWTDTLSDSGLALFVGLADSSTLGAYPAAHNHGFDRSFTGIPTTDTKRMQTFLRAEMKRRGISEAQARAVPPFGGPIYANSVAVPGPCKAGEGVDPDGNVRWNGGAARYVYVAEDDAKNPGVPPNLDLPVGTLWRLDVLASAQPITAPLAYGTTPEGSFQRVPEKTDAEPLEQGTQYLLTVLRDVGLPIASCVFTFGDDVPELQPGATTDAGTTTDAGSSSACDLPDDGFGAICYDAENSSDCPCAADYCAIMPGQTSGYCTRSGCKDDPSVCPAEWSCFDVSAFQAGAPAICLAP
jgi:hypothetical protein